MNVLIFSGGSGSDSLQKGLYNEYPELDITVLTNAYDNGKSTGAIRQVFDGKILGPSDVRKNQARHYALENGEDEVFKFIEHRFTNDDPESYIAGYYEGLPQSEKLTRLYHIVEEYFKTSDKAYDIAYEDFSIGNIIYGFLAARFDNSLQRAADYMRQLLNIRQETVLNSDESLFLQAVTESGRILRDEADIVDYENAEDKIVDIQFLTVDGDVVESSFLDQRAIDAIHRADMIIFSTGTQWSSLIPTYKCRTANGESFAKIIDSAKAKKFFLVNGKPDKDMYGINGDGIIETVRQYFDIVDGTQIISGDTEIKPSIGHIANLNGTKYEPNALAREIFWLYFNKPTHKDMFIFDWDDTVQGRKGSYSEFSHMNKTRLPPNSVIITGNSHTKVDVKNLTVYADGGVNKYNNGKFEKCLNDDAKISKETYSKVKEFMQKFGFNMSMLQNRADVCLSIKPIDDQYRKLMAESLRCCTDGLGVYITGNTTIDIMHPLNNKLIALKDVCDNIKFNNIFYVGDELTEGNDSIIEDNKHKYGIITYEVNSPKDTFTFLKTVRVVE